MPPVSMASFGNGLPGTVMPEWTHWPIMNGDWIHFACFKKHKRCKTIAHPGGIKMVGMFSGDGIFSYGMHENNAIKTVCAIEHNENAGESLTMNHPEAIVDAMDVKE